MNADLDGIDEVEAIRRRLRLAFWFGLQERPLPQWVRVRS